MSLAAKAPRTGAERFEEIYAASPDPWDYCTSAYEREKYADTLAALPDRALGATLELGCSIGVFTAQLAARCERVLGLDFSERALEIAAQDLRGTANVELAHASFPEQAPEGPWDVVVCSEVLYYLDLATLGTAIAWLVSQLDAGACVIVVSWRGEGREEPFSGDEVHDLLVQRLARWHVLDARRPGYRLDRFDGDHDGA